MVAQNNSAKTRNQVTSKSGISVDTNLSIRQLKQNQKMAAKKAAQAAKIAKKNNGPGRMKQMWQVFQMTRKNDPASQWWIIGALVIGAVVGVLLAFFFGGGNLLAIILWVVLGLLSGILVAMILLGRRAERAAYNQIEGQPGAVGAVLKSGLRGGWLGSEMPVVVNGKTQDAIFRAIGRAGVVLISEGPRSRTLKMLADEQRKIERVLPNVPIHHITVGREDDSVPLAKLAANLRQRKNILTKAEVTVISKRLNSLSNSLPIPKGVDPMKARAKHR